MRLVASLILAVSGVGRAPATPQPVATGYVVVGKASWVRASLGERYLALPRSPRGTRVRVCGPAACVERWSTDVGPDQDVFPDRVVDLSRADFEAVSDRSPEVAGLVLVTVEYLDHPAAP